MATLNDNLRIIYTSSGCAGLELTRAEAPGQEPELAPLLALQETTGSLHGTVRSASVKHTRLSCQSYEGTGKHLAAFPPRAGEPCFHARNYFLLSSVRGCVKEEAIA